MKEYDCKKMIFSSSATVYGAPKTVPIKEDFPLHTTNPYGTTKLMLEQILTDFCKADPDWHVILLRYFNPIGAHESGLIGESPNGIPNNLMPYITQVAIGKLPYLRVFGDDYDTPDGNRGKRLYPCCGSGERPCRAVEADHAKSGVSIYNLGTGIGYSVLTLSKLLKSKWHYDPISDSGKTCRRYCGLLR